MKLSILSMDQLHALDAAVTQALAKDAARVESRRRLDAIEQIYAVAHRLGMPLAMILNGGKGVSGGARRAAAHYEDPANPANRWGGAGPRPAWLKAALAAGVRLESLRG
ncbi:H-NS family nucleoid-associated regulatory protein [Massilia sp. DWR3-1-1]|uniref:H-NS histone family protein n=1 Tax=Massilia sp. DWR3-1-1 TaxID=2804559 RepID=UPI003CF3DA71